MRLFGVLMAALLLAGGASGAVYEIHVGRGDDAATPIPEPPERWHATWMARVGHVNGQETLIEMPPPADMREFMPFCTCQTFEPRPTPDVTMLAIPAQEPSGNYVLGYANMLSTGDLAAVAWSPPRQTPEAVLVNVTVPQGFAVHAPFAATATVAVEGGTRHTFTQESMRTAGAWFVVVPDSASRPAETEPPASDPALDVGMPYLAIAAAFLAGLLVWAMLVQSGAVQRRGRKQVAATASHRAEAQAPRTVLEARKRALMAALRDLEKAKMDGQVDPAAYDAVKADLKKQTVTVMRALEEQQK